MRHQHRAAWVFCLALGGLLSGSGSLLVRAQTVGHPVAKERSPPGDIPDSQAFIEYRSPLGFTIKVPEGWSRTDRPAGVRFADKYGAIDVAIAGRTEPLTSVTARAMETIQLEQSGRAVKITTIKVAQLPSGTSVLIKYTAKSAPDSVTGKRIRLEHDRYLIARDNKVATIDFSAPEGADNADQWQLMSRSFAW